MSTLNPVLLRLARHTVWKQAAAGLQKSAFQPPEGGGGAPGGAPPMDPSMMGGAPPGGAPPGGAPPMDPSMMGGAPPMADPSMMGMPPGSPGAAAQPAPGQAPGQAGPPKLKPDQLMMMLDYRMYNLQQQMTAIMNALDIKLPPSALIMPPGQPGAPPAESALPGGANDATQGQGQGGAGQSAIQPIEPMQGASPELAQGGGGAPKAASWIGDPIAREMAPSDAQVSPVVGAAAVAAIYRSRVRAGQPVA